MPPATPSLRENSFLSPANYEDDSSSIHSDRDRSDQDTDSEDDEVLMGARSSADIRAHDRGLLLEEEERDRLLEAAASRNGRERRGSGLEAVKRLFSKGHHQDPEKVAVEMQEVGKGKTKTERRRRRRERRRTKKERLFENAEHGEDGELMHEMEEGGMKDGSVTGDSTETEGSDEVDRRGLIGLREDKSSRRRRWRNWCFVHLLILVGFLILVLVAYKLSRQSKIRQSKGMKIGQKMVSNGTAIFAPTTLLISLDGFRADFLNRGITPRLNAFIKEGVSPLYMNPSFPSVTFPNHYTIATGLYPEAHGIVGNSFWDEDLKEEFYYTHADAMDPKWWGGEPIWVTAENDGIRSAIHMWPGSEAHIAGVEPTFLDKYNGREPLPNKVDRILGLLDRPGPEDLDADVADMRPQFIAAYVPNVDAIGHRYGPNSTEIGTTIRDVDTMLDGLFKGLEARNLTGIVNVVVVSDHGMATTDTKRLIQLEDLIDPSLIAHTDGWPLYGLRPKNASDLEPLYNKLLAASLKTANFEVYLRDKTMPARYHFSKNERIAPLWIVPKTGWAIVTRDELDVKNAVEQGMVFRPIGLHGYDHEHPLMRAIFVARGPAFPHLPNSRLEPFQNIEIYNIVCDSLNLTPKPNNGTLRLPLKPIGLHSPATPIPDAHDPDPSIAVPSSSAPSPSSSPTTQQEDEEANNIISISPIEASSAADPDLKPPNVVGVNEPINSAEPSKSPAPKPGNDVGVDEPGKEGNVDRPVVDNGNEKDKSFMKWLQDKIEKMKGWIKGVVDGATDEDKEKGDGGSE